MDTVGMERGGRRGEGRGGNWEIGAQRKVETASSEGEERGG